MRLGTKWLLLLLLLLLMMMLLKQSLSSSEFREIQQQIARSEVADGEG